MDVGRMTDLLDIATRAVEGHGAMQKPTELAALLAIARDNEIAGPVWEIGTATGGTLWAFAVVLGAGATFVSIDMPYGPYGGDQVLAEDDLRALIEPHAAALTVIRGDSRTVDLPKPPPHLLLIDGDHSQDGVRADWDRYAPLVQRTGMIALHDILPHSEVSGVEVAPVWEGIVASEPHTVEIVDLRPAEHGGQWGGWGLVFR